MNKELEALASIKHQLFDWLYHKRKVNDIPIDRRFEIIEKALKEHELMKQTKIIVANKNISDEDLEKLKNQRMYVGSLEQVEIKTLYDEETQNKLKALEIINSKNVQISYLKKWCEKLDDYNCVWGKRGLITRKLTQEEYELLKEVLL